ncbi:hypothetical protein BS47DRAFT_1378243 [Hydnum rufescens UP504]|uniref:RRM domain-containing protein n=1 Tax=Hydnum rufescens UP504 TaxID=1448309 RepID=A0A9P6AHE5_9AGAM|nr:hypothetical protein BS47DRAFT_1378243 [Hydnum rufescens UP504]
MSVLTATSVTGHVKNLPTYISENRIRSHFSTQGGVITDVKLVHKQDGASRRFAFVGFKTDGEAVRAKEYYDRTYIDSSRISVLVVDPCKSRSTQNRTLERPTKRQRVSSAHEARDQSNKPNAKNDAPADPVLSEFLQVMRPRNKKDRSWANDDAVLIPPALPSESKPGEDQQANPNVKPMTDDDTVSDLEWMKRRMGKVVLDDPDAAPRTIHQISFIVVDQVPPPIDPAVESLAETSRLFVRNLAYSCSTSDLEEAFKPFGDLSQVHIPLDATTKAPKGLAFVSFVKPDSALAAYKAMDKSTFQGRILHRVKPEDSGKKSLKENRLRVAKENAARDFNWSMLYMNSDAVVSSVADRLKVSKADILNPDSDDAAVKLALAETHVIQETKKYLEDEGVILDSFKSRQRSETIILVKNIPYGTSIDELNEMFSPHGEIVRLLLPPAGTMGVVEFSHSSEASKALRAIAYRRLKNSIIYLEKAPLGMFKEDEPVIALSHDLVTLEESVAPDAAEPMTAVGGATLFVKNLSFSTTTDRLVKTFRNLTPNRIRKRPGSTLSMGYGFIGFKDPEAAKKAIKSVQGFNLDGHALQASFAQRGVDDTPKEGAKAGGVGKSLTTKMIVKNLPFEVTKKDVRALFSAHGQLKSVRLPRKFDAGSRGFAFLDFISRHEAENAYNALKHTHLLGRHIILEWAEDNGAGGDLDILRERMRVGFGDGKSERPGRKRKLDLDIFNKDGKDDDGDFIAI